MGNPGDNISRIAHEIEAEKKVAATILFYASIGERMVKTPRMKRTSCPHCGAVLEVHFVPRMFICARCRAVRRPCDRCAAYHHCELHECRYDTGAYPEEAVEIVKGGAR